jgi:hypothetical protein
LTKYRYLISISCNSFIFNIPIPTLLFYLLRAVSQLVSLNVQATNIFNALSRFSKCNQSEDWRVLDCYAVSNGKYLRTLQRQYDPQKLHLQQYHCKSLKSRT